MYALRKRNHVRWNPYYSRDTESSYNDEYTKLILQMLPRASIMAFNLSKKQVAYFCNEAWSTGLPCFKVCKLLLDQKMFGIQRKDAMTNIVLALKVGRENLSNLSNKYLHFLVHVSKSWDRLVVAKAIHHYGHGRTKWGKECGLKAFL